MPEGHLSRRTLFGGSLVLALAACEPLGYATGKEHADPDVTTIRRAVAAEQKLLAHHEAVQRRHPDLAARLRPVATEHRAHVRALRARVTPTPAPEPSTAAPSPRVSPPPSAAASLRLLVDQERAAASARIDDCKDASAFLAQLLASISAAEATHAAFLGEAP